MQLALIQGSDHMIAKIPKTKQVYFFLMPEETLSVLEFIKEQRCIIFEPRSNNPKPSESLSFINLFQCFFCPNELRESIDMQKTSEEVYFLDPTTSPVIEFGCCVLNGNKLSRGRFYFRGGYLGRDEWVNFPESLYNSFKTVFSFVKKHFLIQEREYGAFLSKNSKIHVSRGGILTQF